jgi:1-deoxy-D-xylulose-5-phosphate reductoisomerase
MRPKNIVLLGSSGSIGRSTLDVIRNHPDSLKVTALAANANIKLLIEQYFEFRPNQVCLADESLSGELKDKLKGEPVEILSGRDEMVGLAALKSADTVVNAIVGAAGLLASIEAVKNKKILALANKESMVAAGTILQELAKKSGARIIPIDSEHSAIFQVLESHDVSEVKNIILTASGGPFRELPLEKFSEITLEQALNHPTWKMGKKITIDSATLVNKGLEVIEAVNLFSIEPDRVKVVIHPQSIVHSMVEFTDSSIIAQLSLPDMRMPITYALFWPKRTTSEFGKMDFRQMTNLTFEPPDFKRFPALKLAFDVAKRGGTAPAIYNAANEVAVEAFLNRAISFVDIVKTIEETMSEMNIIDNAGLEDVLSADKQARQIAERMAVQPAC